MQENTVLETVNTKLLQKIPFKWKFSVKEVIVYAFAIFYILINNKEGLTEEKIIDGMLSELYTNNPKRTLKEAEFIARQVFLKLLNEIEQH